MTAPTSLFKRVLLGRPFRSDRLSEQLLRKRIALPVFASDALSSVAYAPQEIFLTLSLAGFSGYALSPWVAVAVVVVLLTVVASYRQNVHAYPSGGGDYEVVGTNLGQRFGLVVGSALLVDYVLTVAVSVSAGVENFGAAIPFLADHQVISALAIVAVLMALNLRGIRESGVVFAIPTYGFILGVILMLGWGLVEEVLLGHQLLAESSSFRFTDDASLAGFALVFIVLRSFSSGCAALTGVEAISNGVPAFRKPKSRNAATTLLIMGLLSVSMLVGIIALGMQTGLKYVDDPATQLTGVPANYDQKTVIAQLARAVFDTFPPGFYFLTVVTGLILVLAANTAFNGFPVLGSILAQDRYLPRQLHTRGDRLAFSNGILFLATFAGVLIVAYGASASALINLYIVGVFVSFTLSQIGMVRHWNRLIPEERTASVRRRMLRSRAINGFGAVMTGIVLVVVLSTKFLLGAYVAIAAMVVIYVLMRAIKRHYAKVSEQLRPDADVRMLPSRVHVVVLVSKVHKPTLRALAFARATRPDSLTALTVNVEDEETRALQADWERNDIPVPLTVVDSPYREITRPILDYVRGIRRDSPRDLVMVFVPEYVVGHWWENLLHNQSALRLKGRLLFVPGVMVTNVPYQLQSSEARASADERDRLTPTEVRRGLSRSTRHR